MTKLIEVADHISIVIEKLVRKVIGLALQLFKTPGHTIDITCGSIQGGKV